MDKTTWLEIKENGCALPEGESAAALTEELFSFLGSTDPDLRDVIAYEVFATWLEQGQYTPEELRAYILRLSVNLQEGLGERDTDSVFLRAFSVLCLAEIVHNENKNPFLDKDEIHSILTRGLEYLESEQDPRGFVPDKGWAHALAHTADLLFVLAQNRHVDRLELVHILDGIQAKLTRPADWVYIHAEDDRLVRAVLAVFERKLLDPTTLRAWLLLFSDPDEVSWKASFEDELKQKAFFNTKTFLRSLHLKIVQDETLEHRDELLAGALEALAALKQF